MLAQLPHSRKTGGAPKGAKQMSDPSSDIREARVGSEG